MQADCWKPLLKLCRRMNVVFCFISEKIITYLGRESTHDLFYKQQKIRYIFEKYDCQLIWYILLLANIHRRTEKEQDLWEGSCSFSVNRWLMKGSRNSIS